MANVERIGLLPTEARRANELETSFPDDAIVRIGDGDARAMGVYRDAIEPKALGVVVIVLGSGLSPDSNADSTELRRTLARGRWATLTVTLPDIPNELLPPRQRDKFVEGAAATPAPVPTNAVEGARPAEDPLPARVRDRLDAAVKAARDKGSKVVLLGEGATGAWIAWAKLRGPDADAVVIIDTARDAPRIEGKRPKDVLAEFSSPARRRSAMPKPRSDISRCATPTCAGRTTPAALAIRPIAANVNSVYGIAL